MKINAEIEADICSEFKSKYRLNIEKACFAQNHIPNYILLDSTRNIHSYMEFCVLESGHLSSIHWDEGDILGGLIRVLQVQTSQLDRPLFFIFKEESGTYKVIESNLVKEHILEGNAATIEDFIIENSDTFSEILPLIKREL